jgi:hypothetical protein
MSSPAQQPEDFFRDTVERWVAEAQKSGQLDLTPSDKCRVCRDPVIMGLVNKMLARGFTAPDILDTLDAHNVKLKRDGKPQITKDSIYNHRNRHFDTQAPAAAIWRKIQEDSAREQGMDWTEGVGTVLNAMSYYKTMMVKGYETLIDPMTVISPKDGADAAMKLHEIARKDESAFERAQMMADMGRIIEVVRQFVPSERWPEVQAILRGESFGNAPQAVESVRVVDIDDTPDEEV